MKNQEKPQSSGASGEPDSPIIEIENLCSEGDSICTYGWQTYSKGTGIGISDNKRNSGADEWIKYGFDC